MVTDKILVDLGYADWVVGPLKAAGATVEVFQEVVPDPDLECCQKCLSSVKRFNPDVFIALGGGSAIDLMKMVRMMFESGDVDFDGLTQRFMDIRKRIYEFPEL